MYAEMDNQCCLWLDSIINDKVTSKSNQRDLLVFKALLQEHPNELEECRGKYVAVDRGKLLPFWFHQPGDACEADMQVTYFFFVPTVDKFCSSASMFKQSTHTITVKKMGTTTNEENVYHCPQVNLKLTTSCDGKEVVKSDRYLVDTGATDTSCPRKFVQMDNVNETPRPQPTRISRLVQWATGRNPMHENHDDEASKIVPFFGAFDNSNRVESLVIDTANGTRNSQRIFFRQGFLQMDVENTGKIDVPHLLFDAHSDCDPIRQGNDMELNRNMVLGCDILFKNFTVTMSKKQGNSPTVTLSASGNDLLS